MAKYMRNHFNQRPIQNTSWNQHNMWRQRHNLHNRHFTRPVWTSPLLEFDYKYWCETCDKGFRTPAHLEYHKRLHQKCNIDGCQFVAHPNIITKHIQMQHATGLFKKIGRLNNPEEIQRWREERKKKYPTKENVEKKQAQMKEKIKRGEKMGMTRERNMKKINKDMTKKGKLHLSNRKNIGRLNDRKRTLSELHKKAPLAKKICKIIPPMEENRKLKPFMGVQDLLNEDIIEEDIHDVQSNDLIEDEEQNIPVENANLSEPTLCGALTSLICNYGSSDEDDPEEKTNRTCEKTGKISDQNKRKVEEKDNTLKPNNDVFKIFVKPIEQLIDKNKTLLDNMTDTSKTDFNESEDDSGPEESRIVKENISANDVQTSNNKTRKERSGLANKQRLTRNSIKLRKKLPSTLLEKLLHKEIQHERNIILQCVRYVIEKKYFNEYS